MHHAPQWQEVQGIWRRSHKSTGVGKGRGVAASPEVLDWQPVPEDTLQHPLSLKVQAAAELPPAATSSPGEPARLCPVGAGGPRLDPGAALFAPATGAQALAPAECPAPAELSSGYAPLPSAAARVLIAPLGEAPVAHPEACRGAEPLAPGLQGELFAGAHDGLLAGATSYSAAPPASPDAPSTPRRPSPQLGGGAADVPPPRPRSLAHEGQAAAGSGLSPRSGGCSGGGCGTPQQRLIWSEAVDSEWEEGVASIPPFPVLQPIQSLQHTNSFAALQFGSSSGGEGGTSASEQVECSLSQSSASSLPTTTIRQATDRGNWKHVQRKHASSRKFLPTSLEVPRESGFIEGSEVPQKNRVHAGSEVLQKNKVPAGSEVLQKLLVTAGSEVPQKLQVAEGSEVPKKNKVKAGSEVPQKLMDKSSEVPQKPFNKYHERDLLARQVRSLQLCLNTRGVNAHEVEVISMILAPKVRALQLMDAEVSEAACAFPQLQQQS